jgi:alpha-tubulin suppressor-like RCC1 family protein
MHDIASTERKALGRAGCITASVLLGVLLPSCGGGDGVANPRAEGSTGQIEAALTQIPASVLCVQVTVARSGAVTTLNVMSGQSSASMSLGTPPIGTTTVQAAAYNLACISVTPSTTPDWIGAPVTVDVKPGASVQVNLTLQPNLASTASINFIAPAVAIGTGSFHAFAISSAGTVRAWGYNAYSMIGDGTTVNRASPVSVPSLTSIVSATGGYYHSCALTSAGALLCWGNNSSGQVGDGTLMNRSAPTSVVASGVSKVGCGHNHTCFIKTDGSLWCAGSNSSGQIGNNTTTNVSSFVQVLTSIEQVSGGSAHTCARVITGEVDCWGDNTYGQLGLGTTGAAHTSPTYVTAPTARPAAEVALGENHTCIRKYDGTVWCWGSNASGQLGDGTNVDRSTAVQVSGISSAVQIGAGGSTSCARLQDGTVRCWGEGFNGETGDGSGKASSTPVVVRNISGALEIAVGYNRSCARLDSGTLACWGVDNVGEVGDGVIGPNRFVPTNVAW